jgi:hypothetical protein
MLTMKYDPLFAASSNHIQHESQKQSVKPRRSGGQDAWRRIQGMQQGAAQNSAGASRLTIVMNPIALSGCTTASSTLCLLQMAADGLQIF